MELRPSLDVARRLGIADAAARDRLVRVAGRGHLAQRVDGRFIVAEPVAPASDDVRVEIRDGVRVTICPPRHADGALVFRQALSGGRRGVETAGPPPWSTPPMSTAW